MYENPCFIYFISWSKQKSLTFIFYGYFHWMQNFRMCFFSFSNLDILFHCPFTYIVSKKKSGEILLFVLLYVLCFFPFRIFKRFSVTVFSAILVWSDCYVLSIHACLLVFISLSFVEIPSLCIYLFYPSLEKFSHYFADVSLSLSGSAVIHMLDSLTLFKRLLRFFFSGAIYIVFFCYDFLFICLFSCCV